MILLSGNCVFKDIYLETDNIKNVTTLPDNYNDMVEGMYYIVGDYVYPYIGNQNQIHGFERGCIFKFNNRYIVNQHPDEVKKMYRCTRIIPESVYLEQKQKKKKTIDDLIDSYEKGYQSGSNLMKESRSKIMSVGDVYMPELNEDDDPLERIMKLMIRDMELVLNDFRTDFDKEYSLDNLRSALSGATKNMSITKFLTWCDLLNLEWEFNLMDSAPDVPNPLNQTVTISSSNQCTWFEKDPSTMGKNSFFVKLTAEEDPLKRIIKNALYIKDVDLKQYKSKGSTPHLINNMRSALKSKQKMTLPYFMSWCEILDMTFSIKITNKKSGVWFKIDGDNVFTNSEKYNKKETEESI